MISNQHNCHHRRARGAALSTLVLAAGLLLSVVMAASAVSVPRDFDPHHDAQLSRKVLARDIDVETLLPSYKRVRRGNETLHALGERQYSTEAYWYAKCQPLYIWLKSLGVPDSKLWLDLPKSSAGCCGFDVSDLKANPPIIRRINCVNGILDSIQWGPNALRGDINAKPFIDVSAAQSIATGGAPATAAWTSVDLSGNPDLTGSFPRWLRGAGNTLKTLNLKNTGVRDKLPRIDILFPNLVSFAAGPKISGYVGPMPSSLITCDITPNNYNWDDGICHYRNSSWALSLPAGCYKDMKACSGNAPDPSAPIIPAALAPHWGDVRPPYENYGLKSTADQCQVLRDWFVFHGVAEANLWPNGQDCCSHKILKCDKWGPIWLFASYLGMTGDINSPPNSISQIKGLQYIFFDGNSLTGSFPEWVTTLPDLYNLDLSWNKLNGQIPQLSQCSQIKNVLLQGNYFTGKIPSLVTRNSTYFCSCGNFMGECKFEGGYNSLCWESDPAFYDETCISSNPTIKQCEGNGTIPASTTPVAPETKVTWTCVKSCSDLGHFVKVRQLNSIPARIMCEGPNATACSWYSDNKCTVLAPGEPEPRGSGVVCTQNTQGWCGAAVYALANPNAPESACGVTGPWTCIRSCIDKGNSVMVRSVGNLSAGGTIQCMGPDSNKCSWYSGSGCKTLATNEPEPHMSKEIGYFCSQLEAGWCRIGADTIFRNIQPSSCAEITPTNAGRRDLPDFTLIGGLIALSFTFVFNLFAM